jgi:hypothetical protein
MDQQQFQPRPVHPDTRALRMMGIRLANVSIADVQFRAQVEEIREYAHQIGFHVDEEAGTAQLDPRQVKQIQGLLARLFSLE